MRGPYKSKNIGYHSKSDRRCMPCQVGQSTIVLHAGSLLSPAHLSDDTSTHTHTAVSLETRQGSRAQTTAVSYSRLMSYPCLYTPINSTSRPSQDVTAHTVKGATSCHTTIHPPVPYILRLDDVADVLHVV